MMLISYVDNVDNFLLFVENSFENRLKLHISLSIERIKFKMPGSQGHSTTSVQAHVVSDLLTLTSLVYCIIFSNPILLFSPLSIA